MAFHILDEVEKVVLAIAIPSKRRLKTSATVSEVLANNEEDEQIIEISGCQTWTSLRTGYNIPGVNKISGNNGVLQILLQNEITPESINRQCYSQNIILYHIYQLWKKPGNPFPEITDENKPVL